MSKSAQHLYNAHQVRELDRLAIETIPVDGYELMRRAGLAAFRYLRWRWPRARSVAVYCGSGNNGGDGYVLARVAKLAGLHVKAIALSPSKSETAQKALADFHAVAGCVNEQLDIAADVIVDGLLGTGLQRQVTGDYARAIDHVNHHSSPVLSLDIPSGLDSDTGRILGICVRADTTISFIGRKLGCFTGQGPEQCGALMFDDLQVPNDIYAQVEPLGQIIRPRHESSVIPERSRTAHKGNTGRVLLAGGNYGMLGAIGMSARAAHKSGVGLVNIISRKGHGRALLTLTPESMVQEFEGDRISVQNNFKAIGIGPGLGQDDWARSLWSQVLSHDLPMVLDADALNILALNPRRCDHWILTPHPGEAACLLDCSLSDIEADRVSAIHELQRRYGGVVVLKGAGSLICGTRLDLCDRGNPGMASGGMGDVLTGIITAFLAQGLNPEEAAAYGVWCHAVAGDLGARKGMVGLSASDLIEYLPTVIQANDNE